MYPGLIPSFTAPGAGVVSSTTSAQVPTAESSSETSAEASTEAPSTTPLPTTMPTTTTSLRVITIPAYTFPPRHTYTETSASVASASSGSFSIGFSIPASLLSLLTASTGNAFQIGRRQEQTLTPGIVGSTSVLGFTEGAPPATSEVVATAVSTNITNFSPTSTSASASSDLVTEGATPSLGMASASFVTGTPSTAAATSTFAAGASSSSAGSAASETFIKGSLKSSSATASVLFTEGDQVAQSTSTPSVLTPCSTSTTTAATPKQPIQGINPNSPTGFTEIATSFFASGGGFSNVFDRPSYQDAHVSSYLTSTNLWALGYNNSGSDYSVLDNLGPNQFFNLAGRAYPDVSAIGYNIRMFSGGVPAKASGTSASVPIWAGILTLINEERIKAGKTTVGFVHPVLVSSARLFLLPSTSGGQSLSELPGALEVGL
jgi:hypothetical protein